MPTLDRKEVENLKTTLGHLTNNMASLIYQTVAKLYFCSPECEGWKDTGVWGALCLVMDRTPPASKHIKILDLKTLKLRFSQEIYEGMPYAGLHPRFVAFELDNCIAGISFADQEEAEIFVQRVKSLTPQPSVDSVANVNTTSERGFFARLFGMGKPQIGLPTNVVHKKHIGYEPGVGFDVDSPEGLPDEWKNIFRSAGIQKKDLRDPEKAAVIYSTLQNTLGGHMPGAPQIDDATPHPPSSPPMHQPPSNPVTPLKVGAPPVKGSPGAPASPPAAAIAAGLAGLRPVAKIVVPGSPQPPERFGGPPPPRPSSASVISMGMGGPPPRNTPPASPSGSDIGGMMAMGTMNDLSQQGYDNQDGSQDFYSGAENDEAPLPYPHVPQPPNVRVGGGPPPGAPPAHARGGPPPGAPPGGARLSTVSMVAVPGGAHHGSDADKAASKQKEKEERALQKELEKQKSSDDKERKKREKEEERLQKEAQKQKEKDDKEREKKDKKDRELALKEKEKQDKERTKLDRELAKEQEKQEKEKAKLEKHKGGKDKDDKGKVRSSNAAAAMVPTSQPPPALATHHFPNPADANHAHDAYDPSQYDPYAVNSNFTHDQSQPYDPNLGWDPAHQGQHDQGHGYDQHGYDQAGYDQGQDQQGYDGQGQDYGGYDTSQQPQAQDPKFFWTEMRLEDGTMYYSNSLLEITSWEKPIDIMTDEEKAAAGVTADSSLQSNYEAYVQYQDAYEEEQKAAPVAAEQEEAPAAAAKPAAPDLQAQIAGAKLKKVEKAAAPAAAAAGAGPKKSALPTNLSEQQESSVMGALKAAMANRFRSLNDADHPTLAPGGGGAGGGGGGGAASPRHDDWDDD